MNKTVKKLLQGDVENHILPFFWQHGEDEATLRKYMEVIQKANCNAVCVESRPHPDYCGDTWWRDMDIILDEARTRGMKVWILDDSHFPTGYANGEMKHHPDSLCKQGIFCTTYESKEKASKLTINLKKRKLLELPKRKASLLEKVLTAKKAERIFYDDEILSISMVSKNTGKVIDISKKLINGVIRIEKTEGVYVIKVLVKSRNTGYHRDYINILDQESCKLLINAVYEKHWEHYKDDFGKTIAGFFSDEPELGNGYMYAMGNVLGTTQDLPWSKELETNISSILGSDWKLKLPLLWTEGSVEETAYVRYVYMNEVTNLVRKNFSYQLGDWCRNHGVEYIGHIIEDNGQHCRTGSSLGHYFKSLEGQDMAGIDDIGGQVLPQGEDSPTLNQYRRPRNGEFYHYGLAKLAQSAAAIESLKGGRAMCEIFGNYGWAEGVHLEKYLADHFLVRGINYFVPHAFSPKAFPDPDCPPHFYAHGHNPQYRHFGELMGYMNRVATLTSSGKSVCPVGILYHGESEWAKSDAMPFEKPLRALYDTQIDCHVLPQDIFTRKEFYNTKIDSSFTVNGQNYQVFVVPSTDYISKEATEGVVELCKNHIPVLFVDKYPIGISDTMEKIPDILRTCKVVSLSELPKVVEDLMILHPKLSPACNRIRILHMAGDGDVYMLVNESDETYTGKVILPSRGNCYLYEAWDNVVKSANFISVNKETEVTLTIEPLKSLFVVFGECDVPFTKTFILSGNEIPIHTITRSICEGAMYPNFVNEKEVTLPDNLEVEEPNFSGFVRYRTSFYVEEKRSIILSITNAYEGVEVFINGISQGIQIAPPYNYDISKVVENGYNKVVIEVATTLERQCYPMLSRIRKMMTPKPSAKSGITGTIKLYQQ